MSDDRRLIIGLCAASLLAMLAACWLGSTPMSFGRIMAALTGSGPSGDQIIIRAIRLPRALAAFITGAALGISGAALQGLLRNPLAEPGVLGVSASASLLASFSIYYGLAALSPWVVPIAAIIGALIATAVITLAALRISSVVTLILIGVGLSSFAGALMSLLINFSPNPFTLSDVMNWMLGSVANRSAADIGFAAPFIALGAAMLVFSRRGLSALTLGEEAASGMGLDLTRQRVLTVLGAGLATGGAVALAGAIGFIGIIAPHIIRPFTGHDPARALIPSAILAGLFLVIADIIIRIIPTTNELKLGVAAALIGAPAFIWIAARQNHRGPHG
jgi:iron complex transport system permease protein